MDVKDMAALIEAYDGLRELEDIMGAINGSEGTGHSESVMGRLYRITDVIQRNVTCVGPDDDWDSVLKVIDDEGVPAEDRAKTVLGLK